ncbi:MAG: pyridoxamine 5-phosphate oxidase-related, FMN-binding protein [Thermomicrobiales bacterium]|jgi:PPOX class probable F420-dependent enzyme|nr:pyridoxamine 5-phosphate oxidase-related, FMN-binding protein [Thermomicrobiales bacterium]
MSDVIPEQYADVLDSTALAHVATLGPDGAPQSSPVWFGWDGTHLRFAQVTGYRQKVRNLEREPRVALSIVDPANPYRYLEVRGAVERIEPDPEGAFIDVMARKYLGQERYPWGKPGEEWVVVVIRPERTTQMG